MSDSSQGSVDAPGEENPYAAVQSEQYPRALEDFSQRRPSSLSADLESPPKSPLPPIYEPLPEQVAHLSGVAVDGDEPAPDGAAAAQSAPGSGPATAGEPAAGEPAGGHSAAGEPEPLEPTAPAPAKLLGKVMAISQERPEYIVLGAFAGGLALATLLKRIGRR